MSWQKRLGVPNSIKSSYAQNTQNTQKGNIVDFVDIVSEDSKLYKALSSNIHDTGCCDKDAVNTSDLIALSQSQRKLMDEGKVPTHYSKEAMCEQCGPIWLWESGRVMGCPWCWNRLAGNPIPRPPI